MYTPKTLFTGYKLGLKTADAYIGVPDKYFSNGSSMVEYEGKTVVVQKSQAVTSRTFADKFTVGEHTLFIIIYGKNKMDQNKQDREPRQCHKHNLLIYPFFSMKNNKHYWKHEYRNAAGEQKTCWVNSEEEIDGFKEKQTDYANDQKGS